jgi:hypothetical protein
MSASCTFWIPPGAALAPYAVKMFTTKAWTNASLSLYAATIGLDEWTRLDDVVFQRTPGTGTLGTECLEPVQPSEFSLIPPVQITRAAHPYLVGVPGAPVVGVTRPPGPRPAIAARAGLEAPPTPVDLRRGGGRLMFQGGPVRSEAAAEVQVSRDGLTWETIATVPPGTDWSAVLVDVEAFAGQIVYVRVVTNDDDGIPSKIPTIRRPDCDLTLPLDGNAPQASHTCLPGG